MDAGKAKELVARLEALGEKYAQVWPPAGGEGRQGVAPAGGEGRQGGVGVPTPKGGQAGPCTPVQWRLGCTRAQEGMSAEQPVALRNGFSLVGLDQFRYEDPVDGSVATKQAQPAPCNRMQRRLQPCVTEAATVCNGGRNRV